MKGAFQRIPLAVVGKTKGRGTKITFKPDSESIRNSGIQLGHPRLRRLRELAFLNRGLRITLMDERTEKNQVVPLQREGSYRLLNI